MGVVINKLKVIIGLHETISSGRGPKLIKKIKDHFDKKPLSV